MKAADAANTTYGRWFRPLPISNSELKRLSPDQLGQAPGVGDQDAVRSTVVESRNVVPKEQLAKVNIAASPMEVRRLASPKYPSPSPHGDSPIDSNPFRRPIVGESVSKLANHSSGHLPRRMLWNDTAPSSLAQPDSVTVPSERLQQWVRHVQVSTDLHGETCIARTERQCDMQIPHSPKTKGSPGGQENDIQLPSKSLKKEPFGITRPQNGASPGGALTGTNLEKRLISSSPPPPSEHHHAAGTGGRGSARTWFQTARALLQIRLRATSLQRKRFNCCARYSPQPCRSRALRLAVVPPVLQWLPVSVGVGTCEKRARIRGQQARCAGRQTR
eukprot:1330168-Rhodomonas_salina.1